MKERWKPEIGEAYYFIDSSINVDIEHYDGHTWDDERIAIGNYFNTKDEAQAAAEKVRALLLSLHEPTKDCDQLPKLTAEVFNRPDCPEWAKYAAVHDEKLFFTDQEPEINEHGLLVSANDAARIERISTVPFKSSEHYLSQVIERPTKDAFDKMLKKHAQQQADKIWQKARERRLSEQYHNGPVKETKLPDWCKVGEWVYHDSDGYYYTVKRVDVEDDYIQISDNTMEYTYTANEIKTFFSTARLRPYNAEEIPDLPFEVSEINSDFRTIVVSCKGDKIWLGGAITAISTEDLKRDFTVKGKPCGVLEHLENGEWVR